MRQAGDPEAQRTSEIFQQCVLGEVIDLEAPVTCADCGAEDLELWDSGQTWGETVCEVCYAARIAAGMARGPGGVGHRA